MRLSLSRIIIISLRRIKQEKNKTMKKILFTGLLGLALCFNAFSQSAEMSPSQKLRYAAGIIEAYYVDTVNTTKITDEAIIAMLKTLDPHSSYTTPEETKEMTEPLQGKFSGIGITFNMQSDTLYVLQTVANGPCEKVGIVAGDRIISANDTVISGVKMKNKDVMKLLRGPKGTEVSLKVKRKGKKDLLSFRVVREDIPIYSIDASYMADPTTGYIRISRFAEDTDNEFKDAVKELKKQGMKNLIIDLQDNGGGYLGTAYELASHFLSYNDLVVYTEGLNVSPYYYRTVNRGDLRDGKVIILVNQFSASASEIVAGAIQDNDRGLVVGRRTFGKGLVQRPFPFPDGSMIRLTISRYHTPSGRCIQKPYTLGEEEDYREDIMNRYEAGELMNEDSIHFADSLKYYTLNNNRVVYGGGGVMPDKFVPIDTTETSDYYRQMVGSGNLHKFCLNYVDENRDKLKKKYPTDDDFVKKFEVSDDMMKKLIGQCEQDSIKYNEEQYRCSEKLIKTVVKANIASDVYGSKSFYKVTNPSDNAFKVALDLINNDEEYYRLLKEGAKK